MKNIIYFGFLLFLISCSSDSAWDCAQTSGKIIQTEIPVTDFTKILVWERTKLFIEQGEVQKVVVETGENLFSDVEVSVTDGRLELRNNNACNILRDYGITKIYVTTPNLTEIRSSTGLDIESIGVLKFPKLLLLSEDQNMPEYHVNGDFRLQLEVDNLEIVANGFSNFYLNGLANKANFGLFSGNCRIFSEDLIVQDLNIYNRSSANMIVNPQQSIQGKIVGLGNVISKNRPAIVDVEELFKGRLIFE